MASIKLQHPLRLTPYLQTPLLVFFFLSSLQSFTYAQQTIGNQPTSPDNPFATPSNGVPPLPGYAPNSDPNNTNNGSGVSVSRYYFIILGVIILIFLISGWFLIRKRTQSIAQTRAGGGQTTGGPGGDTESRRWTTGRWRLTPARLEEGLNERGEAPPPYIPGQSPPPAIHVDNGVRHPVTGELIPLEDLSGKPPDYDGHSSSEEDLNLTRPRPAYAASDRSAPRRHLLGGTGSSEESTGAELPGASEETRMRRIDEMGHDSTMGAHGMPEMPKMSNNEGHVEMPEMKDEETTPNSETILPKHDGSSRDLGIISTKPEGPSGEPPSSSSRPEHGDSTAPM